MNQVKAIRQRLGLTQEAFGDGIGCTQGNIGHYERGQVVLPHVAERIIEFSASHGLVLTFDHVYGKADIPATGEVLGA